MATEDAFTDAIENFKAKIRAAKEDLVEDLQLAIGGRGLTQEDRITYLLHNTAFAAVHCMYELLTDLTLGSPDDYATALHELLELACQQYLGSLPDESNSA